LTCSRDISPHSSRHKDQIKVKKVSNDVESYNKRGNKPFLVKDVGKSRVGAEQPSRVRYVREFSLFVVFVTTHRTLAPRSPCPESTAQANTALREKMSVIGLFLSPYNAHTGRFGQKPNGRFSTSSSEPFSIPNLSYYF
jgi:hypothetical protein